MQVEKSYFPKMQGLSYNHRMWDIHEFVRKRVEDLGIDYVDLSRAAGRSHSYAQQFVTRRSPRKLDEDTRRKWAEALKCNEAMLRPDYHPGADEDHTRVVVPDPERNDAANFEVREAYAAESFKPKLFGGIPQIDAEVGAGLGNVGEVLTIESGGVQSGHLVTSEWVVPPLASFGNHARIIVLPVIGTSMEPILREGDHVFVDTYSQTIKHGEIYVLDEDDGPIVKRARLLKDNDPVLIEIISENKAIPPMTRPAHRVRVIGRVIGRWSKF